ncbi:MAG TPA: hypothetical protein PLL76_19435 [Thermoanaerobaculia bacterium]|jgi:hypothetical protein|nr:hypothetical protein [Thermoanaerobaculia bacterium]HQP88428.1 hypothetical protein [Thermoanaerobaculia bacterium]
MNTAISTPAFEELLLEGADRDVRDLRLLEEAAGAACTTPRGLLLYGHLCLLSGRAARALRCYRDLLDANPEDVGARLGRLVALDALGARTAEDTRAAEALFRAASETDRRLLSPLASAPLRRAAWNSVGALVAGALERRVAGQEQGRTRLVELVTERLEGGPGGQAPVAALAGPEGVGRTSAVRTIARTLLRGERVLTVRADDLPARVEPDGPLLVLVDGLAAARAEDLNLAARLVSELARHPAVVLVALKMPGPGRAGRRPVGFPVAAPSVESLTGRLGAALASAADAEVHFPALDEETARKAVSLAWRERAWPLAVEAGGWDELDAPDLDAVFRAAWNGGGLPRLPEELGRAASGPRKRRTLWERTPVFHP